MDRLVLSNETRETGLYLRRLHVMIALFLVLLAGVAARYFFLQIVNHKYYVAHSENNRVQMRPVAPVRGLIYDRNGALLVENKPVLNLLLNTDVIGDMEATLARLRELIGVTEQEIKRFQESRVKSAASNVPLRIGLSVEEVARLAVTRHTLPGVEVGARLARHYPYADLLAHPLGYLGRIDADERRRLPSRRYYGTYMVGKTGLEKFYEGRLHGQVGYERVEVNAWGKIQRSLEHRPSEPGGDIYLHLDLDLQRAAREALGPYTGAIVALDVDTGGVLAMVSAPQFDPNEFVSGFDPGHYKDFVASRRGPLFNRAVQGQYSPASTFKPVMALAGLKSGLIDPEYRIWDPGYYELGDRTYYDWLERGRGWVNLHRSIEESCDTYYYALAHRMGLAPMVEMASAFGFGRVTGIDLPYESPGLLPDHLWKYDHYGESWVDGDTLNMSIGQGYLLATPLQLAAFAMHLANRGVKKVPRLLRGEAAPGGESLIILPEEDWDTVLDAMEDVVHGAAGTARTAAEGLRYRIVGKTGTVQLVQLVRDEEGALIEPEEDIRELRDHAVFMGFAPAENPAIAVAVILEHGRFGGAVAAPTARKVFDTWLLGGGRKAPRGP